MSLKKSALRALLRASATFIAHPTTPLPIQRAALTRAGITMRAPRGTRRQEERLAGRPVCKLTAPGADAGRALLYLHGGAYVSGGIPSHTGLAAQLGARAQATAWLLDYRLAPENPYPAAVDDALAAYRELLAKDIDPARIAIAGDSAGGGLTLATALAIRDAGLPQPAALALISPWTDLTLSGASMQSKAKDDPMLNAAWLDWAAGLYCTNTVRTHPGVSPLFADLAGLPPMIVHVGSDEVLFDDARHLATLATKAGITCELRVFDGLWHVFQAQAGLLGEADESLAAMGAFIARQCRAR